MCARGALGPARRAARGRLSARRARRHPGAGPELDTRFLALRDDVIYSVRSRRYFDVILWPRLSELAGTELPRPAPRRGIRRRGPSMSELTHLVTEIEGRP